METIDLIFDEDKSKKAFERYFLFERKRNYRKLPLKFVLGTCLTLIILGLLLDIYIFWIIGCSSIGFSILFLFYFYVRFKYYQSKFFKEFKKRSKEMDEEILFSFDNQGIYYKSENMKSEIKWPMIKRYALDGQNIYLYLSNNELFDVISEDIIGESAFGNFKTLLEEKSKLID